MKIIISIIFLYISFASHAQQKGDVVATPEELKLYNLINQYRKEQGLDEIPFSKSLTYVAQMHCKDLDENIGHLTHGWSSCNYDSGNSNTYPCMWLKPSELTAYKGYGYECALGGTGGYVANAESSLKGWKSSKPHNDVILNQGIWSDSNWKALGVGILNGYACIWFGEESDE